MRTAKRMRTAFGVTLLCLLSLAACGKDKKTEAQASDVQSCESNDDCEAGWVCLDSECADTSSGAAYTAPGSAVTPDKVRNEVQRIQEQAQKRNDELLDGL